MEVYCINCDEKFQEVILAYDSFHDEYECFCLKCKEPIYVPLVNDMNVKIRRGKKENG